jgi:hypothetical protein
MMIGAEEEPQDMGELLHRNIWRKGQILAHVQAMGPVPSLLHFHVRPEDKDISQIEIGSTGTIFLKLNIFQLKWRIEYPKEEDGILELTSEGVQPDRDVEEV